MGPQEWKRLIGESAWRHIMASDDSHPDGVVENMVAGILARAVEAGFTPPPIIPLIAPDGTKVLWPRGGDLVEPVLTAAGLQRHYNNRGHGFLLMRVPQLLRAVAGPLLPWLQTIMFAYEEQCESEAIEPLPVDWQVFVGGHDPGELAIVLHRRLKEASPIPNPAAIQRKTFQPGSKP